MRVVTFFLLSLAISLQLFCQERYQPDKVIPPSPTAASLGVYGDIPVSYYTGTTNFGIPLYNIKTTNHSLPVSLQYSSSGLIVGQDASWVGLGWSLIASGVITRSIRGLDDFSQDRGYHSLGPLPPNDDKNDYLYPGEQSPLKWDYAYYFRDIKTGIKDGEPDVFFYNFAGYTGKFVIGKQVNGGHVYTAQANNLKITYSDMNTSGSFGTWLITTPNGYKYYFNTPEAIESYYSNSIIPEIALQGLNAEYYTRSYNESASSWYLDSIESPSGEKIIFTYETGRSLSSVVESQKRYDRLIGNIAEVYNYFNQSRSDIRDVYLKRITFTNGYLEFNRSNRIDIEPFPGSSTLPQKLSEVILYNNSSQPVKKWVLGYSYFNNNNNGLSYHYKRLKLESVTEIGSNDVAGNPYLFTYFDPENLPGKYNRQTDSWGYYNAMAYSPTLQGEFRPTLLPPVTVNTENGALTFPGSERTPDATGNYLKKGVLIAVKYPTGGKTVFEYEPNDYPEVVTNTYTTGTTSYSVFQNDYYLPEENKPIQDFTITASNPAKLWLHAYCLPSQDPVPADDMVYIIDLNNNSIYQVFNLMNGTPVNNDPSNKSQTWQFTLPAGNYRLQCNLITDFSVDCSLEIGQAETHTTQTTINKKGGGLRIRSIENFDFNEKRISSKKIGYTWSNGQSSGGVHKPLQYFQQHVVICEVEPANEGNVLVRSSTSMNPLGLYSEAGPVCYSNVIVYEGLNGEGGWTRYLYHNAPTPVSVDTRECQVPAVADGLNGKIMLSEVSDNKGQLIKRITYEYEKKYEEVLKGVVMIKPYMDHCESYLFSDQTKFYDNVSEWYVLSSETEENYLNGTVVSSTRTLHYDNAAHKQITSQELLGSEGAVIATAYKYPHDFSTQAPYDEMVAKNIIAPIVEQITSKGGIPLESTQTVYANWNGYIAPLTINSRKGTSAYQPRVHYYGYDGSGNVISASKENDFKSSYIWGYNKAFPVVKADNVTAADLQNAVNSALLNIGINGIDNLDQFLNSLGALSTAQQKAVLKNFTAALRQQLATYKTTFSIYTYTPLIGMTSATDANNLTVYYEYDMLNRLTVVKDNDGNIINTYKYNYRQ